MRLLLLACAVMALIPEISVGGNNTRTASIAESLPEWIWATGDNTSFDVILSRSFTCEQSITEARLQLAADFASCSVALNGTTVAAVDNYGPLLNLDVAPYLKLGDNSIQLSAKSTAGPAAIALSLKIFAGEDVTQVVTDSTWNARTNFAVSSGKVNSKFWGDPQRSRITAFDDYTQWQLASEKDTAAPAAVFTLPGFEAELLRKAGADEGSWVSMAFDPKGRLTIAREDKGLLRMTLGADGKAESVESINASLMECRGLLYAHGDLYANANNSKGLYRLHDSNADDQFDVVQLLRSFPGGVGHGRNDLALGPDGMIYSIHGDSVELPQSDIRDWTSPFRDGQLQKPQSQGHVVRTDKDGQNWELMTTGLRNPFGIDFNQDGELFTYDADAEFDMGAPWYRPTRLNQLTSGADFGWRGLTQQWPPYELDHPDNALPTATIGKGSPTAVKFGTTSHFPEPWRNALFILDWTYGRIVACHLFPRGAGYVCRSETFAKGRPLNVTDLDFGPDGGMYIITGGRKTESSLYRIRWVGESSEQPITTHQSARQAFSKQQRELRRQLEQRHQRDDRENVVDSVWPHLANVDPVIRQAACVALEHQDVGHWKQRALAETDARLASVALLALARGTAPETAPEIIAALSRLETVDLSAYDKLTVLQAWARCLTDPSSLDADLLQPTQALLESWLSRETNAAPTFAPTGAGDVVAKLSRLDMTIDDTAVNADIVRLMKMSTRQEDRMLNLFLLRNATTGWEADDRETFFHILNDVEQTAIGGDGMPGFLKQIREAAVASLSRSERNRLGDLVQRTDPAKDPPVTKSRPHVRDWAFGDIGELLAAAGRSGVSSERGRELFNAASCGRCHRVGLQGGVVGPDLTSVGSRFSQRDLLNSILEPSAVVAEKYRNVQVVTQAGKTIVGRVISRGDYRSPSMQIATDPLDATKVVEIRKVEVESHQESTISPMPKGLLSTLNADEIADLLAYLVSAASTR